MQRKNIIVVVHEDKKADCYGNLKKACTAHKLTYNTIVKQKLPITKEGLFIQRVPFK